MSDAPNEQPTEEIISNLLQPSGEPMSDVELKLQLLHLAKDVIQQNAAMRWETHKRCETIDVDMIIHEAKKLLKFINK